MPGLGLKYFLLLLWNLRCSSAQFRNLLSQLNDVFRKSQDLVCYGDAAADAIVDVCDACQIHLDQAKFYHLTFNA